MEGFWILVKIVVKDLFSVEMREGGVLKNEKVFYMVGVESIEGSSREDFGKDGGMK